VFSRNLELVNGQTFLSESTGSLACPHNVKN